MNWVEQRDLSNVQILLLFVTAVSVLKIPTAVLRLDIFLCPVILVFVVSFSKDRISIIYLTVLREKMFYTLDLSGSPATLKGNRSIYGGASFFLPLTKNSIPFIQQRKKLKVLLSLTLVQTCVIPGCMMLSEMRKQSLKIDFLHLFLYTKTNAKIYI